MQQQEEPLPPLPVMSAQEFLERGKIPDCVKDINSFDGKQQELATFIADVQLVIDDYREEGATERQMQILQRAIRRRIQGHAADILAQHNVMYDWEEIKETLLFEYRDKRDILTLDYELFAIKRGPQEPLLTFQNRIQELLTTCISQVNTDPELCADAHSHIRQYRRRARDAFIRGVESKMGLWVLSNKPQSVREAYNLCLDYCNFTARDQGANELRLMRANAQHIAPPPPPRKFNTNPFLNHHPKQNPFTNPPIQKINQNLVYKPTNPFQQYPSNSQNFGNQPPRRLPPPEPMDVDPSLRTRQVDYVNRPPFKRPLNSFQGANPPFKRQAHPVEQGECSTNLEEEQYYPPEIYQDPLDQYDQAYQYTEEDEAAGIEHAELNFLEWSPSW